MTFYAVKMTSFDQCIGDENSAFYDYLLPDHTF